MGLLAWAVEALWRERGNWERVLIGFTALEFVFLVAWIALGLG